MKFNGQNIIADSDIVMTGLLAGHNLSEVLNKHDEDISNLKSNVKWIYKYGGVGSGSGGSLPTAPWNFKVELDDVVRENGSKVNLGTLKEYKLFLQLYKVQGRTFDIRYTYNSESGGVKIVEKRITPSQPSSFTDLINLQVNGTLAISINDDEGNYAQFTMDYIVTAYSFAIDYVYADDKSIFYPVDNNIFITDVQSRNGLLVRLTLIISVDIKDYYIKYQNWNLDWITMTDIDPTDEYIYLNLDKPINNDNAGNYTFTIEPHIILAGNNEEERIEALLLGDNLIPDTIYLKVEADGTIYNTNTVDNPHQFYAGEIVFKVTGFLGFKDTTTSYVFNVYLNDAKYTSDNLISELSDLYEEAVSINITELGWQKITFQIARKNAVYEKTYWICTKSALGSFTWYPSYTVQSGAGASTSTANPKISYLYKYSQPIHSIALRIPGTPSISNLISQVVGGTSKTYITPIDTTYQDKDCLISIGIKFNKLNDLSRKIITISGSASSNNIEIYQNKIIIMGKTYNLFYLPMDDKFHLVSIYRRAASKENGASLFEFIVYIDGVIEVTLPEFVSTLEYYHTIVLNSGLYKINYLELSYFNHTIIADSELTLLELYNPNPNKYLLTHLTDTGILYHYYSYKLTFEPESIPDNFQRIYSYVSLFYNNTNTGRVEVTNTGIAAIALDIEIPVLMLKYREPRDGNNPNHNSDGSAILNWMQESIDIKNNPNALSYSYPVNVAYSKGKEELKNIVVPENVSFQLFLQGTSTLIYTSKNFDLALSTSSSDYTYLYSPNYSSGDPSTFLPEKRFTIKADVVDSSHSNNNAIGKFVNTICTKFQDLQSVHTNSKYKAYLKNTLEGFPILLFLENAYYKNQTTEELTTDYYFLGIYNFNLGRDSEFNLGFKDLRLLPENITNGFAITEIPNDVVIDGNTTLNVNSYLSNLGVMEINENRNYFDFSQDHDSILFPVNSDDNDYMFSKFKANNLDILKDSIRNLVTGVSYSGGFIFENLGKNLKTDKSPGERFGYGYDLGYKSEIPTNSVPNYKIQLERTFVDAQSNLTKIGDKSSGTLANLSNLILGNEDDGINPLLDYISLTEYFVICMAFGLLDSVLKNMNFRKWLDKFYLAFYDMDTCLGKDNAGNNSDYLCFSDYWAPASISGTSYNELSPAISYKDWYDSRLEGGFDIPSSYLFAVAKYSSKFITDGTVLDWYPQNVWARFRRKRTLLLWDPPSFGNINHIGCLPNADSFVDNFFANHLEKVPDALFNLNYRIKYLHVINNKIFANEDWKKLSGRRIHYVRDWLNSRFHILDLYFNMASIQDSVITYDISDDAWNTNESSSYPLPNSIFIDSTNEDIIVCQDAFVASESGSESTKYSSNIDVIFTTDAHSPIVLAGGFLGRYLTDSNITQKYRFKIDSNNKSGRLGGSKNWLTLNSINSLIQGNVFYVNSDKLTVLNGNAKSCGGWHIKLPALEKVTLTSASYTGDLEFTGADNWPNLTDIEISNSKLGLIINNVGVKKIIATEVGPAQNLILRNCNNLSSVNLSGSIFESIQMTLPLKVVFFGSNTYKQDGSGKWEVDASNDPPKCSNLTLTCPSGDGVLFISDQTYVSNDVERGLSTLVVSGYKEIYIDNCPYLQEIIINDNVVLQKLHVKNCAGATSTEYFRIGNTNKVVDLRNLTALTEVNFYYTKKFEKVYLPNNVQIQSSGFSFTNIKTLDGNNLKLSTSAFAYSAFTLLLNDGTLCSFDATLQIDSLNSAFRNCNILLNTLKLFNSTYTTLLNRLTNTDYMWWANPATEYNEEYLLEDYRDGKCRFDFSMYKNVTTAKGMLGGAKVYACHADTLEGFAIDSTQVNLNNLYGWSELSGEVVTIPINWLEHVKTKVTNCNSTIDSVTYKIVEYDESADTIKQKTTFSPKDLFGGNSSNKITELKYWVFDPGHIIDLKDAFSEFPALQTIYKSFVNCNGKNLEYVQNINGSESTKGFLYSNTTITDILGSFGFNNYNFITVDWANFLNWTSLPSNYKGFLYIIYWDEKYHTWQFNKTLNSVNLFNTIYNLLLNKYTGNSLFGVFYNCTIDDSSNYQIKLTTVNTEITSIPYLFSGLKIADNYINWNWNMIDTLPNVVNFTHAFEKIKFANGLPFNLFKRRNENISSVWVKNSDEDFLQAVLHKYTYTQDIQNMLYCFLECEFEIPMYNLETNLVKSYLEIAGEVLETNVYYSDNSVLANEYKLENTEFDDITQVEKVAFISLLGPSSFPLVIIPGKDTIDKPYYNWDMHSAYVNQSLLPPDIFYGCTNTVDLTGCFKNSNLQGYIPDNLFKNCKSAIIKNFLSNVLVFPKYYDKKYSASQDELLDIYYYIGTNFINSTNLDEAFDFRIHLPGELILGASNINTKLLHVFCFSDSFSVNLNSMKNALPASIRPAPEGTIFIILHLPNNIYLNIMYDKLDEEIIKDSDDNELEIKRIGTLGFQLNRYNKLMLDKLVNGLFSQFMYGNVFAGYTTLSTLKRTSEEVITLGNADGQFGVSRNAEWPAAPNAVTKLIRHYPLKYKLSTDNGYALSLDGIGVKIFKRNVQDFDINTAANYNASRVNNTTYIINFIE